MLKQWPFTFALALVGGGTASLFGWPFLGILASVFVGLFVGAGIDFSRSEKTKWRSS